MQNTIIPNTQKYRPSFRGNFTTLEKNMIQEVRDFALKNKTETARIIKNGKNITDRFDLFEMHNSVTLLPNNSKIFGINLGFLGKILNYKRDLKGSTYIHSHNTETPLSRPDILFAIKAKLNKIVAITPSGKNSTLEIENNNEKILENLNVFDEPLSILENLENQYGEDVLFKNNIALETYKNAMIKAWKNFVEKTKVKYSSNL